MAAGEASASAVLQPYRPRFQCAHGVGALRCFGTWRHGCDGFLAANGDVPSAAAFSAECRCGIPRAGNRAETVCRSGRIASPFLNFLLAGAGAPLYNEDSGAPVFPFAVDILLHPFHCACGMMELKLDWGRFYMKAVPRQNGRGKGECENEEAFARD